MKEIIRTIRNDVKSDEAKLMREHGLSWFHLKGYHRELISSEKYKEIYKWTKDDGKIFYTHTSMRNTQYKNVFINIEVYNEWINYEGDFYFVLSDIRGGFSPRWLHVKEVRKMNLEIGTGTTQGVKIPQELFHEFDIIKSN